MDDEFSTSPEHEYGQSEDPSMSGGEETPMDAEPSTRPRWQLIVAGVLIGLVILLVLMALFGVFKTEPPPPATNAFITIVEPGQGAVLPVPEMVTVRGQAGGLFENSLVVQALDESGNMLVQQPTTIDTTEVGGTGDWSVDLVIPVKPGSSGLIFVFSSSPEDGSIIASSSVEVTYGKEITTTTQITIREPEEGTTLDLSKPVIVRGTGEGLFEGNVVVQALDEAGGVIVEEATTMPSAEVGGPGEWSIEITVEVVGGTQGSIRAFSPSPADGSVMAEDRVAVTYGEAEPTEPSPTEIAPTEPPPGSELIGLTWTVEMILPQVFQPVVGVVQDLTEPIEDTTMTLIFKEEGALEGQGGCNRFEGRYEVDRVEIEILEITATRLNCDEPQGIMEQETHYLGLLERAERYYPMEQGDEQTLVLVEVREDEEDLEQPLLEFKGE